MVGDVTEAEVQLAVPQATLTMQKHIPLSILQNAVNKAGDYTITEADGGMHSIIATGDTGTWWHTYKPVLLIGVYITIVTLLINHDGSGFNWHSWMQHFMAAFFLVFSFFKLLDLKGFAESYATYDIVARKWFAWGYVYSFIELALGLAFLLNFNPVVTNVVTFIVMTVSIIGVLESVVNKRKIQCACLGTVFNIPMSTVTIIEDALMIGMSGVMLLTFM